jgi:formylglycine-generating enzyme
VPHQPLNLAAQLKRFIIGVLCARKNGGCPHADMVGLFLAFKYEIRMPPRRFVCVFPIAVTTIQGALTADSQYRERARDRLLKISYCQPVTYPIHVRFKSTSKVSIMLTDVARISADVRTSVGAMVTFPPGEFEMGSKDGAPAERPHRVCHVSQFQLDRFLVTNADFARFAKETGYRTTCERRGSGWGFRDGIFKEVENLSWRSFASAERSAHPVVLVSWDDAIVYANWIGKRLPTEAEWEYAAKAAAEGGPFPWGRNEPSQDNCGAGRTWQNGPGTSPVGLFPDQCGVFDLVGNVWQWCSDQIDQEVLQRRLENTAIPIREGKSTIDQELRARRGGAWNVAQSFRLRCSNRGAYPREGAAPNLGFRCAH